jgi:aspartyl protease family protein
MFIDIRIWSVEECKFRKMSIMIDTGASVTTISDYILTGIGYTGGGKPIMVTTASGVVEVQTKTIEKIKIGALELSDINVYAHIFPDECFSDGVVGMNILEHFNFRVNLDDNILELDERR